MKNKIKQLNNSSSSTKGIIAGIFAAISFGFIPIFSKPTLSAGFTPACILTYRFGLAAVILLAVLMYQRKRISISLGTVLPMLMLTVFYSMSGGFLVLGYKYMSGGVTGVIHFTYPIWVMLILAAFYKEKINVSSALAILIALMGIYCLGVLGGNSSFIPGTNKILGIAIVLSSGIACAGYMVGVNKTRCHKMPSLVLTFWLMLFSALLFFVIALCDNSLQPVVEPKMMFDFVSLSLLSTVLSNFLLVYAIKNIGSTYASILGAVEPATAVISCAILFGESLTLPIIIGILLILSAVMIIILRAKK